MLMKSLRRNTRDGRNRASGFSLLEMVITIAILIIASCVAVVSLIPLLNTQHVTNAYNTTLGTLRQARDCAVSQRTSYQVTFTQGVGTPGQIAVTATLAFPGDPCSATYLLPTDVLFQTNSAITTTTPPDTGAGANFGTGAHAIDFGYTGSGGTGGQSTIYFCPDGSAQTTSTCAGSGNWDDGVVYLARTGDLLSSRAVDLWGGTGRVRGWRLYTNTSGGYQWIRQ
jgi:prepilin-type N-terminal cleavage/methylation domain-containing protein